MHASMGDDGKRTLAYLPDKLDGRVDSTFFDPADQATRFDCKEIRFN